jgi:site-specific DNA recombinase
MLSALKRSTGALERERDLQQKRVKRLENERRRLVRAHLDGAVPVDLLKEEQFRITMELGEAQRQLNATDVDWEMVETNLTLALGLVSDCKQAYRRGGPRVRRRYNQAFFEAVYVDSDGVSYARLTEPFSKVLPVEVLDRVQETKNPEPQGSGRGSNKIDLVGDEGLEPPTLSV